MGDGGGIGAFAGGFAKSFAASREQRRLRDLDLMRQQQKEAHEQRMENQFREQQDFRVNQQKAVEQYRAGQVQLQEKQMQVQKKKLDLDIMSGMEKAFDPKTPKAQRQFILKQTFKTMEIDPKSQEAKDFMAMASGLDDEQLKETRSALLTMLPEASPGEITAFSKAIVSGQLQMKDALAAFQEARKSKRLAEINSGTGGGGGVPTQKVQSRIMSPEPMAQQQPGGDMPIPGMEQPSGEPTAGGATAQQIRDRASELFAAGFTTEGSAQVALAHQLEQTKDVELKEIVGPDGKNVWVKEQDAVGKEAPGMRPVKNPEEERLSAAAKASVDKDYARIQPWLDDATTAKSTAPLITAFKIANKSGKFVTGSFSNFRENVTKIAELVGMDREKIEAFTGLDIGDAAIAETMKGASAQIGILLADKLGRATNMQVGYIQEALPSLMKTPRGNEIAVDLLERANERAIKIERLYDTYQDEHGGDLRPKAKTPGGKKPPSFFEEADRIRREPLVSEELEKEIKDEAKKGGAIDVESLWEKAQGDKGQIIELGDFGKFQVKDKTDKGVHIITLKNGKDYPVARDEADFNNLPSGPFLWVDPLDDKKTGVRVKK